MLSFKSLPVLMGVFAAFFMASPAAGSIVKALELEELVGQSEQIVLGKVVFSESFVRANGNIGTWHRIQVERDIRGNSPIEGEVIVETLGGQVGDIAMQVAGEPNLVVGERVVVFARAGQGRSVLRPIGMAQGVMRIRLQDAIETISQSREGLLLLRRGVDGRWQKSEGALPRAQRLDVFLDQVRAIVGQQTAQEQR